MTDHDRRQGEVAAGRPIRRWEAWWLRADPWPVLLLALALMGGYFWVYRSPTVAMVGLAYYSDFCLSSFLFALLAAAARGVQLLVRNSYEARFGVHSGAYRSRRRFWPWLLVIAVGTCLMLRSQLPMYLCFRLSRKALDRVADEALTDPANAHLLAGRLAGLYRVTGVEVIGSTVVLYLGKDKGSYGFVRVPGATGDEILNIPGLEDNAAYYRDFPKQHGSTDPVGTRITGDWFVMYSSYWLVKVGWS